MDFSQILFLIFTTAFSIDYKQDKLIEQSTLPLLINVQCTKYIQYHGKSGPQQSSRNIQAANFEWNEFLTWLTGMYYCMHATAVMQQSHCCSAVLQCCDMSHTDTGAAQLASAMGPWSSNFSPVDTAVCCCNTITLHTTIWCWCIWTSLTTTKCCKSIYLLLCRVLEVMNIIIISVITKCEASK